MSSLFYHFDVQLPGTQFVGRTTILFTSAQKLIPRTAAEELKRIFAEAYAPSSTIFIGFEDSINEIQRLISSDELNHVHIPITRDRTYRYFFNKSGELCKATGSKSLVPRKIKAAIQRQGLSTIFSNRNGMMRSGESYHYVKPSGGHSSNFLRPGNVLLNGPEVDFIASWIIRNFLHQPLAIYTDTASITPIAYAAAALANRLNITNGHHTISSFGSYEGLREGSQISFERSALVLISASTSGRLEDRIMRWGCSPENIITLFSISKGNRALCDLRYDEKENPAGIQDVKTYSEYDCPMCAAGSLPVTIAGDSFLPETPDPELKLLRLTDQPKWQPTILKAIEGKRVCSCHMPATNAGDRDYPLHLDLSPLCEVNEFKENFEASFSRLLRLGIDVIIHLPDPASSSLARTALEEYKKQSHAEPKILRADSDLDDALVTLHKEKNQLLDVIVIASCVAAGFSLLSVSRSLRNHANHIGYFMALALPANSEAFKHFVNNLGLRNDEKGKNPVEVVWKGALPKLGFGQSSSWDKELKWLRELASHAAIPEILRGRFDALNDPNRRKGGLTDDSFLPSVTKKKLVLAKNFAFHKCGDDSNLSQADVYFVVSSMLHELRAKRGDGGLQQSMNSHALLDPKNFDRFNDGVLQAALLRSATSSELAYNTHALASRSMGGLIQRMIDHKEDPEGEALPEFLLAIVTRRMTICAPELHNLTETLERAANGDEYLGLFLSSLQEMR